MNCTKRVKNNEETITMTMDNFIEFIGAGRHTANKIAEQAEAKIYIGRRVLINMDKVRNYLNSISE
jgi:polyribonucleotide nucleotidyltransferase